MDFSVFLQVFNFFGSLNMTEGPTKTQDSGVEADCRGTLGCFPRSFPWESFERPVFLPPEKLELIKPFFCFHSSHHPKCKRIDGKPDLDFDNLDLTPEMYIVLITHGFLHSVEAPWVKDLVSLMLEKLEADVQVVTLDWSDGASPPYAQAVSNTRLVGALAGRLVELLHKKKNMKLSQIHLVGHSLGAHLLGYAGRYISRVFPNQKVGRITGLDPAGPYFRSTLKIVHLDFSDAYFVDIFHTDSTSLVPTLPVSLGLPEASAHLDFFPNGGELQKDCRKSPYNFIMDENEIGNGVMKYVSCSHDLAKDYFASSLFNRCQFVGVECESWTKYKQGKCWDCNSRLCYTMGFKTMRAKYERKPKKTPIFKDDIGDLISSGENNIKLYLVASSNQDTCDNQYRFTLFAAKEANPKTNDTIEPSEGVDVSDLTFVIRGKNGSAEVSSGMGTFNMGYGSKLRWVDGVASSIGSIHSAVITYQRRPKILALFGSEEGSVARLERLVIEPLLAGKTKVLHFCQKEFKEGETVILKEKC